MLKPNFAPTTSAEQPGLSIDPLVHGAKILGRGLRALLPGPFLLILAVEALIQASLGVRLWYSFQGGTPAGFLRKELYDASAFLVSPFTAWDSSTPLERTGVFHLSTVVAMDVYLFAGVGAIVAYTLLRGGFGLVRWQLHRVSKHNRRSAPAPMATQTTVVASDAGLSDQVA